MELKLTMKYDDGTEQRLMRCQAPDSMVWLSIPGTQYQEGRGLELLEKIGIEAERIIAAKPESGEVAGSAQTILDAVRKLGYTSPDDIPLEQQTA